MCFLILTFGIPFLHQKQMVNTIRKFELILKINYSTSNSSLEPEKVEMVFLFMLNKRETYFLICFFNFSIVYSDFCKF